MTLDIVFAQNVAGGEGYVPAPFFVEGLFVEPPTITNSSQATGTGATVLRAAYKPGRVKIFDDVKEFHGGEATIHTSAAQLTDFATGYAVWFSLVALKHAVSGAISLVWVAGTVATLATAVVPTMDEIVEELGVDDRGCVAILGDIRFYRVSDLVVQHAVSHERRPAYVDEDSKTSVTPSQGDQASMKAEFWGYVTMDVDLTALSTKSAGQLYIDGVSLPPLPFGGYLGAPEYIPSVTSAGAGADLTVLLNIDGTPVTGGGSIQLTLANAALSGKVTGSAPTGAHKFLPGATLDLELDVKTTVFTGGSGTIRVPVYKYAA